MDINDVIKFTITASDDDVRRIVETLNCRRKLLATESKIAVQIGDEVSFKDRHGQTVTGILSKKNGARAKVAVGSVIWNVPYTLLSKNSSL